MLILGLKGLTQRALTSQSISNRFFNKPRTLNLSPLKLVKINKKINIPFICHIAELTELKGYKIHTTTTTIETIKISYKTIYIFTYLLANEIKEPEHWVRQQFLSA